MLPSVATFNVFFPSEASSGLSFFAALPSSAFSPVPPEHAVNAMARTSNTVNNALLFFICLSPLQIIKINNFQKTL